MNMRALLAVLATGLALNSLGYAADTSATAGSGKVEKGKDFIGRNVVNPNGDKIGTVNDFVTDLESGRVLYVLVSSGGFLGIGDHLSAVPPAQLRANADGNALVLNADKEKLKSAPQFSKERADNLADATFVRDVYSYYGEPASWFDAAKAGAAFKNVHRASDLLKMKIVNTREERLGSVQDLALAPSARRVLYVILDPDRSLDEGAGFFYPLPPMALTMGRDKDTLVTELDKGTLASSPRFKEADWQQITTPAFAANVYRSRGKQFYWEDGEVSSAPVRTEANLKADQAAPTPAQPRARAIQRAASRTNTFGPIVGAESLMGWQVQGPGGAKLGTLRDLAIDLESGRILYGIVDEKGLGVRDNRAVAPGAFRSVNEADKTIVAEYGQRRLADAPSMPRDRAEFTSAQFIADVYRFWGEPTWWIDPSRPETASGKFGNVYRTSGMDGLRVLNSSGQDFGKAQNVMVDLPDGRVAYVLLSTGGAGRNGDLIPVPPMALTASDQGRALTINLDGERLQSAPRITRSELQRLDDPAFAATVYRYYGKGMWWGNAPSATGRD